MPIPCYLTLSGDNQGDMSSGATGADSIGTLSNSNHENEIQVQAFKMGMMVPKDPQSGQPTGRRIHTGVTFTKVVDKSSPMIMQALATGEQIKQATFKFFRTSPSGEQEHYYTLELEEALITEVTPWFPNALDPANGSIGHMEDVTMSYKVINVTHEVAGTSGADNWNK
jgi:type VI secretion system secreted protein Hcp